MSLTAVPFGTTGMTVTRVGFGAFHRPTGVTASIVGARDPRQVDGWIGAPNMSLTTTDITDIAAAVRRTGAGHGRI